jgi:hypothetical protein
MPTPEASRHSGKAKRAKAKPVRASDPFRALAETLWAWRVDFAQHWADRKWGLDLRTRPFREQVIEWLEVRHFFEYANELRSSLGGLTSEIVNFYTSIERGELEDDRARDEAIQIVEGSAKQLAERVMEMQKRCRTVRQPVPNPPARWKQKDVPILDADHQRIRLRTGANWIHLTSTQTKMLAVLFGANGGWVKGRTISDHPHKTRKSMPKPVHAIIETSRADGYRIRALLPQ